MKKPPRLPESNKSSGPRCARCGVAGEKLTPNYQGQKVCKECDAAEDSRYYRTAVEHKEEYLKKYWPNGTPPPPPRPMDLDKHLSSFAQELPTKDDDPWHIANKAATGGLSPDAAYLNNIILEQREMMKAMHRQMEMSIRSVSMHLTSRLVELEAQIHEQSETIKDLIEELSE